MERAEAAVPRADAVRESRPASAAEVVAQVGLPAPIAPPAPRGTATRVLGVTDTRTRPPVTKGRRARRGAHSVAGRADSGRRGRRTGPRAIVLSAPPARGSPAAVGRTDVPRE